MERQFNHFLLLLARQYRGKSQTEVANAAGLNQGHYSRIENGLLPEGPSEENLGRIADALSFPSSFFYQRDSLSGLPLSVHPMHRKKASVGERALKQVHAELNIRLMHVRRLLSAIDVEPELPLPWIDVDEGGGPQEIARLVRQSWMIPRGPLGNLTELVERAGILVVLCNFDAPIDGVTMRLPDVPPCMFINAEVPADRMRSSMAHELGHVIMHRIPTDNIEHEANVFAAELLCPEKDIKRDLIGRLSLEKLVRLKAYWKVSMQFILYRAKSIGCITDNQSQYLWKQISRLGWRVREPAETDFPHDEPQLFPEIIALHFRDLDYEVSDFTNLLHVDQDDLRHLYGMHSEESRRAHLHIIK